MLTSVATNPTSSSQYSPFILPAYLSFWSSSAQLSCRTTCHSNHPRWQIMKFYSRCCREWELKSCCAAQQRGLSLPSFTGALFWFSRCFLGLGYAGRRRWNWNFFHMWNGEIFATSFLYTNCGFVNMTLIEEDLVCGSFLFVLKLTNNSKIPLVKFAALR